MNGFSGFGNSPAKQTKFPNSLSAIARRNKKNPKGDGSDYKMLEKKPVGPVDKNVENDDDQVQENMSNRETFSGETFLEKAQKLEKDHNVSANITEGSIESQDLRRKENEKKK